MQLFQQSWKKICNEEPRDNEETKITDLQMTEQPETKVPDQETPEEISIKNMQSRGKGKGNGSTTTESKDQNPVVTDEIPDEILRQVVVKAEFPRENEAPDFHKGGVPGFAVKRPGSPNVHSAKKSRTEPTERFENHELDNASDRPEILPPEESATKHEEPKAVVMDSQVVIHHPEANPIVIRLASDTKIHQIVAAEEALGTLIPPIVIADVMGIPLHPQTMIAGNDNVVLHQGGLNPGRCPMEKENEHPKLLNANRSQLLWKQEGWVAVDEMQFYAQQIAQDFPQQVGTGVSITDDPLGPTKLGERLFQMIEQSHAIGQKKVVDFILFRNHWTPVCVETSSTNARISTTPAQGHWLKSMCQAAWGESDLEFGTHPIGQVFGADCGFQSIAWVIAKLNNHDSHPKMTIQQAIQWRKSFASFLADPGNDWLVEKPLQLGGMQSNHEQLQQLVQQHGVAASRSSQCADELIRSLGQSTIAGILKSPRPWADLKARANLHSPPIRVVLASELQDAIRNRVQQGVVGSKQSKAKKRVDQNEGFQLQAKQIAIPHAVFKQADGDELSQIQPSQINGSCRGILVLNTSEELPYCQLTQPVSKGGVAILVPDHDDHRLPEHRTIIRVPAQCVTTKEPIIATMAMLQIGGQVVSRNMPQQCVEIEEVANEVIRIAIYKDQFKGDWESFASSPVKQILALPSLAALDTNGILDVWDRQFLTLRLTKEVPKDASVFMVNLRLHHDQVKVLEAANAHEGLYVEPRNNTGRQPSEKYQVVWLPKKTFAEAQVSNQMNQAPSSLVRSGNRYGLRVMTQDAEKVHLEHRPDVMYLDGTELRKYRVGPLPYGSTKQSIVNAFKKWGWTARPLGPQGQSQDKSGTMWVVQSAAPPTHWVFQMQHGDVLISPDVTADPSQANVMQPSVIASTKTLQSLKNEANHASTSHDHEAKDKHDPWTHRDPWQSYNTRELSVGQVASMQAQLEAKIDQRLKESLPNAEDCSMHEDAETRISSLEAQVQQITSNFQSFQQQQIQHNHGMYSQLQTLDKQMHEQHQSLTNVLDSKLEDQMMRIEALLTKRSRTE